jgi:hypothetical protein
MNYRIPVKEKGGESLTTLSYYIGLTVKLSGDPVAQTTGPPTN